ncbi:MAG: hypothetical protein KDJ99_15180, partial [Candidatus Competibacteraceae bacterium]|nr:hypothetical protein [Candidatus Competibacteraceae bacterium]
MNKNNTAKALEAALASLERQLYNHPDAEVKNIDRLRYSCHQHTVAMCKALTALIQAFSDKKIVCLVEAELLSLGFRARPEDIVAWIESVGIFVIEIKSHTISGIRRFENNVPYVMYNGVEEGDVHLVEQPRDFAYKLRSDLERYLEDEGLDCPALYFAGWLPNVSQNDLASCNAVVAPDKVWLSDML